VDHCAAPIVNWALLESASEGEELQCGEGLTTRSAAQGNFDDADSMEEG
jgi:hypothetical protein